MADDHFEQQGIDPDDEVAYMSAAGAHTRSLPSPT
jgi:hypothetical protein